MITDQGSKIRVLPGTAKKKKKSLLDILNSQEQRKEEKKVKEKVELSFAFLSLVLRKLGLKLKVPRRLL